MLGASRGSSDRPVRYDLGNPRTLMVAESVGCGLVLDMWHPVNRGAWDVKLVAFVIWFICDVLAPSEVGGVGGNFVCVTHSGLPLVLRNITGLGLRMVVL